MARPSAASLNSLAQVLRQAQSLYDECRLILNHLDGNEGMAAVSALEATQADQNRDLANNGAASIPLSVFERIRSVRRVV